MSTGSETLRTAGRFVLGGLLGRGAHGAVYEASDTTTGQIVAVKVFGDGTDPSRIRREIAALRLLRVRGVAQFIEEGLVNGAVYLAMERVLGRDFPGTDKPAPWERIAPTVTTLFETLAEVHSAGIVHRDLKPANVLVDAAGRPTLVDFGVSWGANIANVRTLEGQIIGTPAYLSPEQIRGEQAGIATDLYAAGIMIYEALSGVVPHGGSSAGLLYRRVREPAQPLLEVAPRTPRTVARVVDQLLRTDPLDRPRSADLVVAMLTQMSGFGEAALPRLGGRDPVDEICRALERGRSVVVEGPRGSGRTSTLDDAMRRCADGGRRVVALVPGRLPYTSLAPALPELALDDRSVVEVDALVEQALLGSLRAGTLVFVDDVEACDARTQRLLARASTHGGIALARVPVAAPDGPHRGDLTVVRLRDFDERELGELFLGGDRVFHTRADSARILHRLTGGRAARVVGELTRWLRLGAVRWQGHKLSVDPGLIDDLDARPAASVFDGAVPAHLGEAMEWLALSPCGVDVAVLGRAMKLRRFEVEGLIEELTARGAVERRGEVVIASGTARNAEPWTPAMIRCAHRALANALVVGSPGRLGHLLAGTDTADPIAPRVIAEEAVASSRRWVSEGRLSRAIAGLADSASALRASADPAALEQVVVEWVRVAVMVRVPVALDRVLSELARLASFPRVLVLQRFVHAALSVLTGGARAIEQLEALDLLANDDLELERLHLLVIAARRAELPTEQRLIAKATAWAYANGDDEARARAASWQGHLSFREGAFAEAARHHREAARLTRNAVVTVEALLDTATAEMEDSDLVGAARDAELALAAAAAARNSLQEARAEGLLRALAYREDRATAIDEELLSLMPKVGSADLEAQVALTEAAVAFRLGQTERAKELATHAYTLWQEQGRAVSAALARSLAATCGHPLVPAAVSELVDQATAAEPAVALQMVALLARAQPRLRASVRELTLRLAERVPARRLVHRLEVLSPQEAIELVRGQWPAT